MPPLPIQSCSAGDSLPGNVLPRALLQDLSAIVLRPCRQLTFSVTANLTAPMVARVALGVSSRPARVCLYNPSVGTILGASDAPFPSCDGYRVVPRRST